MRLPPDWAKVPLHYLADVRSGLAKNERREGKTVKRPYLRVANVQDGMLDLSDVQEIEVPASQVARFTLQKGDLLLIEGNGNPENLGRGCLWDGQISDIVHQNHVFAVRTLSNSQLLPEFLEIQIQSDYGRNYFLSCAKGSTGLSSLNSTQLKEFPLVVPPLKDQIQITAVVGAWSAAIQKTEQLIAAKERHYTHELSRLIGRGHHPRSHVGSFAYEISKRNRGGRPALLGDFLTESREPATDQDPARRLTVRLHLQGVEARPVRGTESDGATTYFRRRAGQLIYGKQNIFRGAIGIVPPELDGYASTQDLPAFDIADGIDPQWLYFWLSRKDFYISLEALAAGSGSKRLHPEEFFKVRVYLPDLATQTAIARYLNALREEIALLGQSLDALKRQKRGLMQKLLTGQWRLPVPGQEIA
ncbi:MAG: restriction endonuclease subunit S [Rhodocyclaceae bacterium]|nr:restriction endonuclease subunit S [Rhodocyclaceae bacterium]